MRFGLLTPSVGPMDQIIAVSLSFLLEQFHRNSIENRQVNNLSDARVALAFKIWNPVWRQGRDEIIAISTYSGTAFQFIFRLERGKLCLLACSPSCCWGPLVLANFQRANCSVTEGYPAGLRACPGSPDVR
jgi:hypothetical protein